jgi:hypothetical protein
MCEALCAGDLPGFLLPVDKSLTPSFALPLSLLLP